jgi:hypothetical protein
MNDLVVHDLVMMMVHRMFHRVMMVHDMVAMVHDMVAVMDDMVMLHNDHLLRRRGLGAARDEHGGRERYRRGNADCGEKRFHRMFPWLNDAA